MDAVESWREFNVAIVGATAALAGLVIVAASVNIGDIVKSRTLTARLGSAIVMLVVALIASAVALMPGVDEQSLGVLLLIAALRIRTSLVPMAKCFIILSLAAYTLLNYVGMDRLIAENNIARFEETGKIDRYYLNNLSADAIPTLVDFAVKRQDAELKELLANRRARLIDESRDWQSFNLSVYSAKKAVQTISNPN